MCVSTDNRDTCHVRTKVMLTDDQYGETRTGIRGRGGGGGGGGGGGMIITLRNSFQRRLVLSYGTSPGSNQHLLQEKKYYKSSIVSCSNDSLGSPIIYLFVSCSMDIHIHWKPFQRILLTANMCAKHCCQLLLRLKNQTIFKGI